jgi:hypothetical protein
VAEPTFFEVLDGSVNELEGNQLETTFLEPGNDLSDQTTLYAIGLIEILVRRYLRRCFSTYLDHDIGAFAVVCHIWSWCWGDEREM